MKIDWNTVAAVVIALALLAILNKMFFNGLIAKVPTVLSFEEGYEI